MAWLRSIGVLLCLLAATPLRAELILDDFDDPALAVSPEMENDIVITPNVGGLNAERQIRVAASAANPNAILDANVTSDSVFTAVCPR